MAFTVFPVPKPREIHRPYLVLAALQVLDVLTTGWILHHFAGATEGNPIVDFIFNGAGLFVGLGILLAFKLGTVYLLWTCQTGPKIATAIYSLVVANNVLALLLWLLT